MSWVQEISANILDKKKIQIKDYLNGLISESSPIDEIGLLIFSRIYHIHLSVLLKGYIWMTNANENIEKCDMTLVYRGCLAFNDATRKIDNSGNSDDNKGELHQEVQMEMVQIQFQMPHYLCQKLNQGIPLIPKRQVS